MIMPRIYPISKVPKEYNPKTGKQANEEVPEGMGQMQYAVKLASERAGRTTARDVINQGTDMFIPPLMLANIASVKTRFIVGGATLLQLVYMTEVGVIILESDVPLGFKELFFIFMERTFFALILFTIFTALIMPF